MNKEIKKQWIKALKSGKYEQGWGLLRNDDNQFCCLGVLCDIVNPAKWEKVKNSNYYSHEVETTCLSFSIKDKVKLHKSDENELVGLNDIKKMSFEQIADWIEENL